MTIDRESLRPAFERIFGASPYELWLERYGEGASWPGHYKESKTQLAWDVYCAAFESLGEPAGYASNDRLNAIISAAQFDSALPKNRSEYTVALYRLPEVKA